MRLPKFGDSELQSTSSNLEEQPIGADCENSKKMEQVPQHFAFLNPCTNKHENHYRSQSRNDSMRLWIGDCHCQKGNHGSNISSSPTCISWAISCISWATCELHYRIVLSCSRHRLHNRHHSISLPLHHCYQGLLHRNSKISLDICERQLKSSLSWDYLGKFLEGQCIVNGSRPYCGPSPRNQPNHHWELHFHTNGTKC